MKSYSRTTNFITTSTKYKQGQREISVFIRWHPCEVMYKIYVSNSENLIIPNFIEIPLLQVVFTELPAPIV